MKCVASSVPMSTGYPHWLNTVVFRCRHEKLMEGVLKKIIETPDAKSLHDIFYWQSQNSKQNPQWAVRQGDWKLLHSPFEVKESELTADKFLLVNIKTDSTETINHAQHT